jgi:hypothetical protein
MKSLVLNIRDFFNRRTKATDAFKEAHVNRQTLVLQNGESAKRLLKNEDFALMFNLYRFHMLEQLEEADSDEKRIGNAYYVAGVRDFISFIEKSEYLAKKLEKSKLNEMV